MHEFDFINRPKELLTPEVVALLTRLHECRGRQELFIEAEPDVLTALLEVAKIQSTDASNRIEGIYTSDERLKAIVQEKVQPRNRNEEEISGYRDVLATIHESYEHITPRPNSILQLHRDLYSFSSSAVGGVYKNSDNIIAEKHADGTETVRFRPVPAFQTADAMLNLCTRYNDAIEAATYNPLILMPIFILDFLCIHPFNDGNGRMSRLLTLLLLYRAGFIVGKYISIEMLIEKSKDSYYEALQASSQDWHEDTIFPSSSTCWGSWLRPIMNSRTVLSTFVIARYPSLSASRPSLSALLARSPRRRYPRPARTLASPPSSAPCPTLLPPVTSRRQEPAGLRPMLRNNPPIDLFS